MAKKLDDEEDKLGRMRPLGPDKACDTNENVRYRWRRCNGAGQRQKSWQAASVWTSAALRRLRIAARNTNHHVAVDSRSRPAPDLNRLHFLIIASSSGVNAPSGHESSLVDSYLVVSIDNRCVARICKLVCVRSLFSFKSTQYPMQTIRPRVSLSWSWSKQ